MRIRIPQSWSSTLAVATTLSMLAALAVPTRAAADIEGLTIHGFADTYYTSTSQQNGPTGNSGFKLGNLDLYIAPNFTDHIRALMEDVVEFDDWHNPGETNGQAAVDIERLQVGYVVSNELTIWAGRFHTPYGYWNTAYHHGAELQPTVMRPQFVSFEDHGGILPAHMDGMWATGHYSTGPGRVTYDLYFGNGQRIVDHQLDMQNEGNADSHTAVGGRLGYEFRGGPVDTLWIGVHAFQEQVNNFDSGSPDPQTPYARTNVKVTGAFFHWTPLDWELFGEYYRFNNRAHDASTPAQSSTAWYAEADYTFFGRLTPLVRMEKDSLSQTDGYFQYLQGGQSYTRELIGLRYDLNPQTALKWDFDHTETPEAQTTGQQLFLPPYQKSYHEMHLQVAVRF